MTAHGSWHARIACGRQVGAGFLVSARHVLTCAHVVRQHSATGVTVTFPQAPGLPALRAEVIADGGWPARRGGTGSAAPAVLDAGDLAVLELTDDVPLGHAEFAPPGAGYGEPPRKLLVYGFPEHYDEGTLAEYRVTGAQLIADEWVQLESWHGHGQPLARGFSGAAAVLADTGQVVGMVSAAAGARGVRIGRMLPSAVLARYWPRLGELVPTRGFGRDEKTSLRRLVTVAESAGVACTPDQLYVSCVDPVTGPPPPPRGFPSLWAVAWYLLREVDDERAPAEFAARLADFVDDAATRYGLQRWAGQQRERSTPPAGPHTQPHAPGQPARPHPGAPQTARPSHTGPHTGSRATEPTATLPAQPTAHRTPVTRPADPTHADAPADIHADIHADTRTGPARVPWSPIVIEFQRSGAGRGQLLVEVSAYPGGQRRLVGQRTLPKGRARGYVTQRIDEALRELPYGPQILIAFVLPRELLNEPVAGWRRGEDDPSPLGCLYPVVVMDLDRRRKGGLQHGLARKWRWLDARPAADLYRVECGSSEDQGRLTVRLWEDGQMVGFTGPPKTARMKRLFTAGLNGSVPVMLWPATGCAGDHPDDVPCRGGAFLDALVDYVHALPPAEIPLHVRELRRSVYLSADRDHWASDLSLLWEDPRCLPQPPPTTSHSPVA